MSELEVMPIEPHQTYAWLLKKHYAHRIPSISYAFGLYDESSLIGVVTYGVPPSGNLKKGIAGDKYAKIVLELNRLVLSESAPKNSASCLIGRSLKYLPNPSIVVSYADTEHGHIGFVYQATNFIYTGLSAKRSNWTIEGLENLHGFTIADMSRGQENRAQYMRDTYGDKFSLTPRSRKHRYIYIVADKKTKAQILKSIKYEILPYPKGDTSRYDAGDSVATQQILFQDGAQVKK